MLANQLEPRSLLEAQARGSRTRGDQVLVADHPDQATALIHDRELGVVAIEEALDHLRHRHVRTDAFRLRRHRSGDRHVGKAALEGGRRVHDLDVLLRDDAAGHHRHDFW
jgi:hypothetical protein